MELRADLDNRHCFADTHQAMHLLMDFLQSMTDLDGAFELSVTTCLDLARRITHVTDTSELGDPDAVSTIKQLRKLQSVEMHPL